MKNSLNQVNFSILMSLYIILQNKGKGTKLAPHNPLELGTGIICHHCSIALYHISVSILGNCLKIITQLY